MNSIILLVAIVCTIFGYLACLYDLHQASRGLTKRVLENLQNEEHFHTLD